MARFFCLFVFWYPHFVNITFIIQANPKQFTSFQFFWRADVCSQVFLIEEGAKMTS